jgi:hypothetical protein
MAYTVSETFEILSQQINKEPMIVLEIEGSQYLYGSAPILETAKWDDPRIQWDNDKNVTWDGEIEKEISRPYIMMKGETGKSITQQLLVDKGGSGSVTVFPIELVDYQGEVARDLSFDQIGEPIAKKSTIWVGFKGGRWPQDFVRSLIGEIDDMTYNAGSITVTTALAVNKARQTSFDKYQSITTSAIDSSQTDIPVEVVEPYLLTQDALTSYIRIEDEIMEVTAKNTASFTVIRGRLGTIAVSHDESEVESYYKLDGHPIDLALKLLHSSEDNDFQTRELNISSLVRVTSTETIQRAIIFDSSDIEDALGAVAGDFINLVGTTSNDGIKTIQSFGQLDTGKSYIIVEEDLTEEVAVNINTQIKSQWAVLPDGAGLDVDHVDTRAFEEVKDIYSASFINYSFPLKDSIENTRDFIIKEICLPQALYLVTREAKTSLRFTSPPFSSQAIPTLNTENMYDITQVKVKRSKHRYLLNRVVYRFNPGVLDDKFFDRTIRSNADSFLRMGKVRRDLVIESTGLTRSPETTQTIDRLSNSILDRYKFAARYIQNVKVLLPIGIRIEIGDIVFFGGADLQLVNIQTGERDFPAAQFEVVNKKLDIIKGEVVLELLETGFGIDGIFATFSAASPLASGSTADRLLLDRLWDDSQYDFERDKWNRWIGLKVRVRSDDYTYDEIATIDRLDPVTDNGLILDPPLPSAPSGGFFVEMAKYTDYTTEELEEVMKLTHCFTMPSALITGVTDNKTFDLDPLDIVNFEVGMTINVHIEDYTLDSETRVIDDITGNTITLDTDLNITVAIDQRLEVYSYAAAKGYRII